MGGGIVGVVSAGGCRGAGRAESATPNFPNDLPGPRSSTDYNLIDLVQRVPRHGTHRPLAHPGAHKKNAGRSAADESKYDEVLGERRYRTVGGKDSADAIFFHFVVATVADHWGW